MNVMLLPLCAMATPSSTKPVQETTVDEVVHHMVGRSIDEFYPDRTTAPGDVVLTVNGLKPKDFNSTISFDLRKGEILA